VNVRGVVAGDSDVTVTKAIAARDEIESTGKHSSRKIGWGPAIRSEGM